MKVARQRSDLLVIKIVPKVKTNADNKAIYTHVKMFTYLCMCLLNHYMKLLENHHRRSQTET